jgi:hypothetical protein
MPCGAQNDCARRPASRTGAIERPKSMSHDTINTSSASLDLGGSNYLIELAARIKAEHEAVSVALKDSVRHAIEAGSLLLEAKEQLKHGQWLPWLRDHCTIAERTAQLYMRCARSRAEIEEQIRNGVADLTLNEASNSGTVIGHPEALELLSRPQNPEP